MTLHKTQSSYRAFLEGKAPAAHPTGIRTNPAEYPSLMKPFQRDITHWALTLGRAAIFAGTGLGKTICQLTWARLIADQTGSQVLILTPLAVAQQTIIEAQKFGIPSVAYASDQTCASSEIVITNYDRMEKFDFSKYVGIVLDESSIIKSHHSKTRAALMELCANVPFRLCCTATPAPNDYVELGNHAEFLGVMTDKEMLATFFVHDGSIRATNVANHGSKPAAEWRLKRHAENDFWRWMATWSVVVRHPRDLGYDEPGYDLPALNHHQITVPVEYRSSLETGTLFPMQANTLSERLAARRDSIDNRVAKAAEIVNGQRDRPWLVWCHLNSESTALAKMIPGAVEVRGSDDYPTKIDRLLGFASGRYPVLVSKPSIAGFGMNFQRCSDMVFVGLNDSFEQLYQTVRRCWRFGQTRDVNAYLLASELEGAVVANLKEKERAAETMASAMALHMRDLSANALRRQRMMNRAGVVHNQPMGVPSWMI